VASIDERPIATIETGPGYFLQFVTVPDGQLAGTGYAALAVRAEPLSGGPVPRVSIEQFNLQSAGVVQFGYGDGWFEPELNPETARSWRWAGESASLRVSDAGRDVTVRIRGENPLRYFDDAPVVRLTAGDRTLAEIRPDRDFTLEAQVPAPTLSAAGNTLVLRSSAAFVAGEREGTADRRRLALRIYSAEVRAQ
jgi:hypothetical protein